MSDLKSTAKGKVDDAASSVKKTAEKVVDKTKDVAHTAGKKMQDGARKLKNA